MKEIDKCMNCGFCKVNCPIYKVTLEEIKSPRGQAILSKKEMIDKIFYYCTLCKACEVECPAKIKLIDVFRDMRVKVKEKYTTRANKEMIENIRKYGNPFGKIKEGEIPKELYCC